MDERNPKASPTGVSIGSNGLSAMYGSEYSSAAIGSIARLAHCAVSSDSANATAQRLGGHHQLADEVLQTLDLFVLASAGMLELRLQPGLSRRDRGIGGAKAQIRTRKTPQTPAGEGLEPPSWLERPPMRGGCLSGLVVGGHRGWT